MPHSGLILKAVSSFYYIEDDTGRVLCCRARGKFRLNSLEPTPGDRIQYEIDENHPGYGILVYVEPRRNYFIRPNIANVDQIVFVASEARPKTDPYLIDKLSVAAKSHGIDFLLCINKNDLVKGDSLAKIYQNSGLTVFQTSAVTGEGMDLLYRSLRNRISVFTGNSGVGKTSLLNELLPGLQRETAEISQKHGRGKHTTRQTELFRLPDSGWIADSPGFASLELSMLADIKYQELSSCFPEFPEGKCRFPDCLHIREPSCEVRRNVESGLISEIRYQSYLRMIHELKNPERS